MSTVDKAKTRLEELEVHEVSVVDRPANRRKFLIVKRQEIEMPNTDKEKQNIKEISKDEGSALALLLDLDNFSDEETEIEDQDHDDEDKGEGSFSQIFKASDAGTALKAVQLAIQKSMGVAGAIKKLGDTPITEEISKALRGVSAALKLMAGDAEAKEIKEEGEASLVQKANSAVERLMAVASKLKELESNAEVTDDLFSELSTISKSMAALAIITKADDKEGDQDTQDTDDQKIQVFVAKGDTSDDPEIVVKVGAKMGKARLGKLRTAVKLLTEVLGEIAPEDGDKKNKKKEKVGKSDDTLAAAISSVAESVKELGTQVQEMKETLTSSIANVTKRVDTLENEPPAPTDSDDEVTVKKSEKQGQSLFHNVIHQ
jgi:hypothetical protein